MRNIYRITKPLYSRAQAIASARAAKGPGIESIILLCELNHVSSWRDWEDNFGNSLTINKDNSIKITYRNNPGIIRDIYYKSSFELISNNSYWCMFLVQKDNMFFWFVGNDGFLRVISRIDNTWVNHPPVLSGINILETVSENYSSEEFKQINIESVNALNRKFKPELGYITQWPPENEEIRLLLKEKRIG